MTDLEKIFKAIEELQPKSAYKLTTHQSNEELVDEEEPQFSEPRQYTIEVRPYNPKSKQYEIGRPAEFFAMSTSETKRFIAELKKLKEYLQDLGSL